MTGPSHRDMILDQFSRQAVPFLTALGTMDEQALRQIVEFTGAGPRRREEAHQRQMEAG